MKKNKIRIIAIRGGHAVLAVIAIAIVCLIVFSIEIRKIFVDYVTEGLNDYVRYSGEKISNRMVNNASASDFISDYYKNGASEEDIYTSLKAIIQTTDAYQVMYVTPDMTGIDYEGVKHNLSGVEYSYVFSTEERGYYYTSNDGLTGQEAFVICSPVTDEEEKVVAYVIEYISTSEIVNDISADGCYSYSFYAILDSDSNCIEMLGIDRISDFCKGDLVGNVREGLDQNSPDWSVIESYVKKGIQKPAHATVGADSRYIAYYPIKDTGLYLMVFVRDTYVNKEVSVYYTSVKSIIIEFALCLILFLAVYVIIMGFIFVQTRETKKELEGKAATDLLTGVNNKLATEEKIADYIRSNPNGQGVLILVDVDNFKKVNDTMGHAFGDEVLRTLGHKLKSLYRSTDIIGRIGGDEFIVFLRDVKEMSIIERESRKLETFFQDFKVGEYVKYAVSGSLGAAIYSMDGTSFEELYKNADHALYEAKHRGKKQLVFYKEDEKDFSKKDAQ